VVDTSGDQNETVEVVFNTPGTASVTAHAGSLLGVSAGNIVAVQSLQADGRSEGVV
jgi:hypothetical protein